MIDRYLAAYEAANGHALAYEAKSEQLGTLSVFRDGQIEIFDAARLAQMTAHLEWRRKTFNVDQRR